MLFLYQGKWVGNIIQVTDFNSTRGFVLLLKITCIYADCAFFFFFSHFSLTVHISPPALCTSLCNPPLWDYFQQSLTSHWKCSLVITCNSAYLQKELAGWCTTEPEGNKHSKRGCNDKYLRQATRYFPIRKPENRLRSSFQFRKDIKACSACNHIYTEIHRIQSKFLFASITKAQKDLNMDPFFYFFLSLRLLMPSLSFSICVLYSALCFSRCCEIPVLGQCLLTSPLFAPLQLCPPCWEPAAGCGMLLEGHLTLFLYMAAAFKSHIVLKLPVWGFPSQSHQLLKGLSWP